MASRIGRTLFAFYCREVEENVARLEEAWNDGSSTRGVSLFLKGICVMRPIVRSRGHFHRWAYDQVSLTLEVKRTAFSGVSRRRFQDSHIPSIQAVGRSDFLIVGAGSRDGSGAVTLQGADGRTGLSVSVARPI